MTRITHFACSLALLSGLGACSLNSEQFVISGKIDKAGGQTLYLERFEGSSPKKIDSTTVSADGSFELSSKLDHCDYYRLSLTNENSLVFIGDTVGSLRVEAPESLAEPKKIEGSEDTRLLQELAQKVRGLIQERSQIVGNQNADPTQINQQLSEWSIRALDFFHQFVDAHYQSPAALAALNQLNPMQDLSYFEKVKNALAPRMNKSDYWKSLEKQIALAQLQLDEDKKREEAFSNGTQAPDINLPSASGPNIALSSLRGKVVLLDFWASWCGPCRAESPNLVRIYKQFKDKGLEIYSVSLDKNESAWKNAIKEDQLNWIHVSDLQFWNSAVAKAYQVNAIPATFLINKEGKIVARNLRGPQLEQQIAELLKANA